MSVRGLHENVQVTQVYEPESESTTTTGYNGHGTTTGDASGIDMQGYDEAMVELSIGSFASGTLDVDLLDSATDSAAAATIITNAAGTEADFAQKTSANADGVYLVRIRAKDHKRYLFIKSQNNGVGAKVFGINCLLSKADKEPVTQTNTVDFSDTTP